MREARVLISPAMAPLKGGGGGGGSGGGGPSVAKESGSMTGEDRWRDPDGSSVNAVSFGFVATAILVSMFLFMALFEHFLRPRSVGGDSTGGDRTGRRSVRLWGRRDGADLEANKLRVPSPEVNFFHLFFLFWFHLWDGIKLSHLLLLFSGLLTCQLCGLDPVILIFYYLYALLSRELKSLVYRRR